MDAGLRLWRVRKRHQHLDALLSSTGSGWVIEFRRDDRSLLTWSFEREADARAQADHRLRELQRAGWTTHW